MAVLQQNASRANSAIHAAIGNIKVTTVLKDIVYESLNLSMI